MDGRVCFVARLLDGEKMAPLGRLSGHPERVFRGVGLPRAIRTDNGVSFASPNALLTAYRAGRRGG